MSNKTSIEWTATVHPDGSVTPGATWNPVRGCVKISAGCANCYAETFAERFRGVKGHPYEQGFDLRLAPGKLGEPLRWKKPRRVFVNSMSDLFQDGVSDEFISNVFAVMALCPQHTFQILTKRAERLQAYLTEMSSDPDAYCFAWAREWIDPTIKVPDLQGEIWPLPNVWLGVSVENQRWKSRIDILRETPAALRFLSIEPLLEDIGELDLRGIHWVIVGGESGHDARPFNVAWARSIIAQCRAAGVPCFVKQLGANVITSTSPGCDAGITMLKFNSRKGGVPEEWAADLRVREFPEPVTCH